MKKKLFLAALLLPLTAAASALSASEPPLDGWFAEGYQTVETSAPDIPFTRLNDGEEQPVTLADYEGEVLLLNFWATWCAPCVEEMPALDALEAELGDEDFRVLVVSNDRRGAEQVLPFYEEHGLENLGVWLDPRGELMRAMETRGLPTSFVIDRDGRIVGRVEGAAPWDSAEAIELLRWYME
ncbi:TlpA disulfide reductase family protein [Aquibaculum arenosum]|uniref:TlpA disulfide reductase family protein n=1 Tax=Aquibaculum arenosum TaxID=3032591 RepID=A0ABT5YL11_9PROT|nr:TlpA disulfide reductase family protein [Fodinicurvata sp. CAU 1616]MDF2095603.1 TlpA disulfide reductase family protein [Fodinicurvata sp. CAU 1616]